MIELLNPALLAGVAAAAAPIIIHVARRRQERRLDWSAMRYLEELLRASRARLRLERWILLALRVLALLLIALLFTRPALAPAGSTVERQGRVAAVILVDDSASSARGLGATRLARSLDLARAYLGTLQAGDEVTVLPLSRLAEAPEDPLYDLAAARARLDAIVPTAVASDLPALLAAGLDRLGRHLNPTVELVLAGDGVDDGRQAGDRARWQDLRARLGAAGGPETVDGTRARPRLVLLSSPATPPEDAWSVESLLVDRSLVPAGAPVGISVRVRHRGTRQPAAPTLQLLIDGRTVHEAPVAIGASGAAEVTLRHVFSEPGPVLIEAVLAGAGDDLPGDDRRALALRVERALPVVVADDDGAGAGAGLVVAAALDPAGDGTGLFAVRRLRLADLDDAALRGVRAVVIAGGLTADPGAVAALERFCAAGGGVLAILGPRAGQPADTWWRDGDGLLPGRVIGPGEGRARPGRPQVGHPAMAPFAGAADTLRAVEVLRWWRLQPAPAAGGAPAAEVLLALDQGDALVAVRPRGLGRSAVLATGFDPAWSSLASAPAVVPLLRGLVADLGSVLLPPRNLRPGDRLVHVPPGRAPGAAATASGPDGAVALEPASWEGRPAVTSPPLRLPGGYRVADGDQPAVYAVAVPASESGLEPLGDAALEGCLGGLPLVRAGDETAVREAFASSAAGREIWRWLLLAALLALVAEGLWSRRTVVGERRLEAS